jgi:DNA-binding NarL/FixJ family response regulator
MPVEAGAGKTMIKILILDDHELVMEGLDQLLKLQPDMEVVAKCRTADEAMAAIGTSKPDVVLIDLKLRHGHGFDLLSALQGAGAPATIVLTASEHEHEWIEAARLGARGVLLKASAPDDLPRCIRTVVSGQRWLTVEGLNLDERLHVREDVERRLSERLTPREIEVLRELSAQRNNEEIAEKLGVASGTVKLHAHHIYDKLGLRGRQDLLAYLASQAY